MPNVVHFVWPSRAGSEDTEANLGGGESEEMPYSAYLSVRSAMLILKPERIYLWVHGLAFSTRRGSYLPAPTREVCSGCQISVNIGWASENDQTTS